MRRFVPTGLIVAALLASSGCGVAQSVAGRQHVDAGDARIAGLWRAAEKFDRARYGFTPLPVSGGVEWESAPGHGYDAMLHTYSPSPDTVRTIAFRRAGDGYRWIGEQQSFTGPGEYDSVDGRLHEQISITYEIEAMSGAPLGRVSVHYWGTDARLGEDPGAELTLAQVRPVLVEWGFR